MRPDSLPRLWRYINLLLTYLHQHILAIQYTMPFTLVCAGKYRTKDKLKIQKNAETKHIPAKATTQNTAKQNYPDLVAFYNTWPGNKVGLFYNAPRVYTGHRLDQ